MKTKLKQILSYVLFIAGIFGLMLMFSESAATEIQWLKTFIFGALLATASFSALYLLSKHTTKYNSTQQTWK